MLEPFHGMAVIVSAAALEETDVRLFPESRHRSQRVRKKLIKKYGGEFKMVPCMFQVGNQIFAHPVMYGQLKREMEAKHRDTYDNAFANIYSGRNPW